MGFLERAVNRELPEWVEDMKEAQRRARAPGLRLMVQLRRGLEMPAKSKSQQMAAGAALSAKRGKRKVGELKGASKSMYRSMSERQLHDLAATKRKGKRRHAAKS
jgi:Protein of unknwon function (DUF3008)